MQSSSETEAVNPGDCQHRSYQCNTRRSGMNPRVEHPRRPGLTRCAIPPARQGMTKFTAHRPGQNIMAFLRAAVIPTAARAPTVLPNPEEHQQPQRRLAGSVGSLVPGGAFIRRWWPGIIHRDHPFRSGFLRGGIQGGFRILAAPNRPGRSPPCDECGRSDRVGDGAERAVQVAAERRGTSDEDNGHKRSD
jgi:hypothetical protein